MRCSICPRSCGALRSETAGEGVCAMPSLPVVARAALHLWEEPPIAGTRGSGTVFFSGCTLGCVFCQNEEINRRNFGQAISVDRLREICLSLVRQGAHNINFVSPTHYAHVLDALLEVPLPVPVVWNSGGYDKVETLRRMEGKVQVYLPDLKYLDAAVSGRYSGAADYPEVATAAIREMVRQTGPCVLSEGLLRRGVVIRHLLLPGQLVGAKAVMDWVAETFPRGTILFSLMSQYTPWAQAAEYPPLGRAVRGSEVRAATDYMRQLGLEGFVQERTSGDACFIPPFDLTGI
ncbi:MAG: 4Fe-4S cluster-binding domain-containing protein [Oscillospiraceae bacterium]|nr:4Fe-4S cluster-binding domain-containing protein [Oscillospiraceae bacterium]